MTGSHIAVTGRSVTLEIYTHENREAQREALGRIGNALRGHGVPETP
jgi:hypothetical protein